LCAARVVALGLFAGLFGSGVFGWNTESVLGSLTQCSSDCTLKLEMNDRNGFEFSSAATLLASLLLLAGCSSPSSADAPSVTFHRDVEPLLQRSCQGCHVAGGIAPFPLMKYSDARPMVDAIVDQTASRTMPPWHAQDTDECTAPHGWKNDIRLSDDEIALLRKWRDENAPEGDMSDAPTPIVPITGLPGVQMELTPATPYSVAPSADQFHCFVLDPKLMTDSFLNGLFVVPGNSAVVHHVLVFSDPTRASAAKADSTGSYDCFGGAGVPNADLLMAWTPGGVPLEYPSNIAAPIAAGSLIVMQVHYHPHSTTTTVSEATTLQLRFSDTAPDYRAVTTLVGNFKTQLPSGDGLLPGPDDPASGPAFIFPSGESAHTETMKFTYKGLRANGISPKIYGVGGHMHYVGTDEKVTLAKADGTSACLMQIPHWDFDWQRRYDYDAAIDDLPALSPGDSLGIRCTYDNTMDNPQVAASLAEQGLTAPHDVSLGETTLDEMCLANITTLVPAN